jgi:hypothetical protein
VSVASRSSAPSGEGSQKAGNFGGSDANTRSAGRNVGLTAPSLVRDLVGAELGVRFEHFTRGRDKGS